MWSRSPEDGACCRYESALAAPTSWAYFPTLSECQSSCRCAALEGFMAGSGGFDRYETERSSLECRCSAETCPSSVAEAAQMMCGGSSSGSVVRREGCGRVMLSGLAGDTWIFERASQSADAGGAGERLVGAVRLSDVPLAPCQTYEWIAGSRFDCDDVTTCQLCGSEAASTLPPCQ